MSIGRAATAGSLVLLTALAAWLRCAPIATMPLWADELHTWAVVTYTSWSDLLTWQMPELGQLPLGFVLPKAAIAVIGSDADWVLRLPSAVCGTLCVPVAFALGRAIASPALGLICAALVVVDPNLVNESQNARMYALLSLLTLLTMWAVVGAYARPERWRWWLLAGAGLAGTMWTHFTAIALWSGVAATVFATTPVARRQVVRGLAACFVVAGVLAVPGLLQLMQASGAGHSPPPVSATQKLGEVVLSASLLVHRSPLSVIVLPAAIVGLGLMLRQCRVAVVLLAVTGGAALLLLFPLRDRHWFLEPRYLMTLQPAIWIGLAAVVVHPVARGLRFAVALGLLTALWLAQWQQVHQFDSWWRWPDKHQVLAATDTFGREASAGEVVVYDPGWLWRIAAEYRGLPFFAPLQDAVLADGDKPLAETLSAGTPQPRAVWLIATMLDGDDDLDRVRRHVARLAAYYGVAFDPSMLAATLLRDHLFLARIAKEGVSARCLAPWTSR